MNDFRVLILAAGLSSRMHAFKPLLKIGEKTIIEHTLDTFLKAGIKEEQIIIVIGYQGEKIKAHLEDRDFIFKVNQDYKKTDMLTSIQIGIEDLSDVHCFITPADIPLVNSKTVLELMTHSQAFIKPTYKGKSGHPILLDASYLDLLKKYKGDLGLRGFLEQEKIPIKKIPVKDKMILYDADTPEDYKLLQNYYKVNKN